RHTSTRTNPVTDKTNAPYWYSTAGGSTPRWGADGSLFPKQALFTAATQGIPHSSRPSPAADTSLTSECKYLSAETTSRAVARSARRSTSREAGACSTKRPSTPLPS
ncbi:hypothetical protein Vretimale_12625, partial [Volvox reticuliferus]